MKYQSLPIATSFRRFRALATRLRKSLKSGRFQQMARVERMELVQKLRRLYAQLHRVIGGRRLQKVLAAGAFVLSLGLNTAQAQTFGAPQINPFNLNGNTESLVVPVAVDIDGDGDMDIMATAYESYNGPKVFYYENTGTPEAPSFAAKVESPFGIMLSETLTSLTAGDLDGDGDFDLLIGSYADYGGGMEDILYYENTGSATNPSFGAGVSSPFGITATGESTVPHLADLDGDGDLDLLYTDYDGDLATFLYQENTGTATSPAFGTQVADPVGLPTDLEYNPFFDLVDMDGDGDLDMIYGTYDYLEVGDTYRAYLNYVENTGTPTAPAFGTPVQEPFGIQYPDESFLPTPAIADFDNDGDFDILSFAYVYDSAPNAEVNVFVYFENESPIVNTEDLYEGADWKIFPSITQGQLNWQLPNSLGEELNLEIYSSTGQLVGAHSVQGEQGDISVDYLASGNYWLRLSSQDGESYKTKQITKQ